MVEKYQQRANLPRSPTFIPSNKMQFTKQVIAVIGVLASSALASDVYSTFLDGNGNDVASVNFDIANTGCFSVPNAVQITFSQGGIELGSTADGPYCLFAYPQGGCSGTITKQQFQDVTINDSSAEYLLNNGVANAASYRWSANAC